MHFRFRGPITDPLKLSSDRQGHPGSKCDGGRDLNPRATEVLLETRVVDTSHIGGGNPTEVPVSTVDEQLLFLLTQQKERFAEETIGDHASGAVRSIVRQRMRRRHQAEFPVAEFGRGQPLQTIVDGETKNLQERRDCFAGLFKLNVASESNASVRVHFGGHVKREQAGVVGQSLAEVFDVLRETLGMSSQLRLDIAGQSDEPGRSPHRFGSDGNPPIAGCPCGCTNQYTDQVSAAGPGSESLLRVHNKSSFGRMTSRSQKWLRLPNSPAVGQVHLVFARGHKRTLVHGQDAGS